MHELSIAGAIVTIAIDAAGGRPVRKVEVKVGYLRQVVVSSLVFSFELVARDTLAEGAELVIEPVPARVRCGDCGGETVIERFPLCCGACGSLAVAVVAGEELEVEWVELDDMDAITSGAATGHTVAGKGVMQ